MQISELFQLMGKIRTKDGQPEEYVVVTFQMNKDNKFAVFHVHSKPDIHFYTPWEGEKSIEKLRADLITHSGTVQ